MFNVLIYNRIDVSFDVFFQWGVMQSRAYTEINLWGGQISPPPRNFSWKFRTFGFLDILKVFTVQLPYKYYFISPSNKTIRKKQQTNFFYVPHSSVWDFKSLIALSSLQVKRGALTPCPPMCTPLSMLYNRPLTCNLSCLWTFAASRTWVL